MAISEQSVHSQVALIPVTSEEMVELLVRENAALVFRVAYSVLRDHHDAEDATQETFIRVLRHRSELATIEEPRAWLVRIAYRVALSRYKSRKGVKEVSTEVLDRLQGTSVPLEEFVHSNEVMALVEMLIAALPLDLRDVLRLSTVDELTSREIGVILEIPEGSVRTRLHRARQLLKERMASRLGAKQ